MSTARNACPRSVAGRRAAAAEVLTAARHGSVRPVAGFAQHVPFSPEPTAAGIAPADKATGIDSHIAEPRRAALSIHPRPSPPARLLRGHCPAAKARRRGICRICQAEQARKRSQGSAGGGCRQRARRRMEDSGAWTPSSPSAAPEPVRGRKLAPKSLGTAKPVPVLLGGCASCRQVPKPGAGCKSLPEPLTGGRAGSLSARN